METANQTTQENENDWVTTMRKKSGCSFNVCIEASWKKVGCIKLRRAALLSLPAGCVLESWRQVEITWNSDNRKEVRPCFMGEIPEDVGYRRNLWEVAKLCKAEGVDCFVYPPNTYPNKSEKLAHFKRVLLGDKLAAAPAANG